MNHRRSTHPVPPPRAHRRPALTRVSAVARKEFIQIGRDPRSLGMAIAIPMLLLLLFGYALTLDVTDVPVVVWDRSGSGVSRELISRFAGSRYFSVRGCTDNYRDLERAIDRREALAALIIPDDFAGRVESGRASQVQFLVDGSDASTATLAIGYAEVVVQTFSQQTALAALRRTGAPPIRAPLDLRPRVWFNEDLESRNFITPGLIAVIMMVIAALLTSLTVAREWERGTMEQLISTPVKGPELIVGKLLPYFVIGMLDVALAALMGKVLFHVPFRGSLVLLFGSAAVFLVGALSMGMLISIVARNQLVASQMAMVSTFLPSFLLSGFVFTISNMPVPVQVVTYLVPARYFVALLKGIYLKGVGLQIVGGEVVLLAVFGTLMFVLANRKFRKRLA